MQSAMSQGLYGLATNFSIACPTGNCTYPASQALGFCSQCHNTTSQVVVECGESHEDVSYGPPHPVLRTCRLTLPVTSQNNQLLSNFTLSIDTDGEAYFQTRWASQSFQRFNSSLFPPSELGVELVSFVAVHRSLEQLSIANVSDQDPIFTAWECSLIFCAYAYPEIHVQDSVVLQHDVSYTSLQLSGQYPNATDGNTLYGMNTGEQNPEQASFWSTRNAFESLGTVLSYSYTTSWATVDRERMVGIIGSVAHVLASGPPDVSQTMHDIAWSMTEFVRTGANSTPHSGKAFILASYIKVRWRYLDLLYLMTAGSVVALVWAILLSRKSGTTYWKSSSLAMLVHRVDRSGDVVGTVRSAGDLKKRAEDWTGRVVEKLAATDSTPPGGPGWSVAVEPLPSGGSASTNSTQHPGL